MGCDLTRYMFVFRWGVVERNVNINIKSAQCHKACRHEFHVFPRPSQSKCSFFITFFQSAAIPGGASCILHKAKELYVHVVFFFFLARHSSLDCM